MFIKNSDHKRQILIIDSELAASKSLSMLLETRGYLVKLAHSAQDGFAVISRDTDLILLDVMLPDQSGFEVCRQLKKNQVTSEIPIIMLGSKLLSQDAVEALYLGADDYLKKPFEYEELIARMETVMKRRLNTTEAAGVSKEDEEIVYELRRIIDNELIIPHFQPIFLFSPFQLLGFEVLTRAKTKSRLADPNILFKAAIKYGCYQELELAGWRKALEYASQHLTSEKLFFNCNPYLIERSDFLKIKNLFEGEKIKIENVFLEITERSMISDFKLFFHHLSYFRDFGFKFVVDDVGGGYASLESIVEIKPEVVKIDHHIINQLDRDPYKKSIVKFLVNFCKENKVLAVAEGIETESILKAVIELNTDAGQGYYLYRPNPEINIKELEKIKLPK